MYVSIILLEGWDLYYSSWDGHPFNVWNNVQGINGDPNGDGKGLENQMLTIPTVTAVQEAYVRKVIDTVNDLDNVLYEISNESRLLGSKVDDGKPLGNCESVCCRMVQPKLQSDATRRECIRRNAAFVSRTMRQRRRVVSQDDWRKGSAAMARVSEHSAKRRRASARWLMMNVRSHRTFVERDGMYKSITAFFRERPAAHHGSYADRSAMGCSSPKNLDRPPLSINSTANYDGAETSASDQE